MLMTIHKTYKLP